MRYKSAEEFEQQLQARQKPSDPDEPPEKPKPGEEEEEDEEKEDDKKEQTAAGVVSMTDSQFAMLVTELRKPTVNPQLEARKKRTREHNRALMRDSNKMLQARFLGCNHMQLPGSVMTGCSCIAWGTQSDGKRRGICQHCGTVFSPIRSECASQEIHDAYPMLVRLPTHPAGNINSVFQAA